MFKYFHLESRIYYCGRCNSVSNDGRLQEVLGEVDNVSEFLSSLISFGINSHEIPTFVIPRRPIISPHLQMYEIREEWVTHGHSEIIPQVY